MIRRKTPYEKELRALAKKEAAWLASHTDKKEPALNRLLNGKVPAGLENTLKTAFFTAFEAVFKNSDKIDRTYSRKHAEITYAINHSAAVLKPDKKHLRAFSGEARRTARGNTALSGVAGIGMGLLGIGLPDIPILVGMLIKGIHQIAQSYGYSHETVKERYYLLLLLECAVSRGEALTRRNAAVDAFTAILANKDDMTVSDTVFTNQMRATADALAEHLLYLKFVQTIPLVGVVGGFSDITVMQTVSGYTELKYRKRFLADRENGVL